MAREIRTRTTIETESISFITSRQVVRAECERCGQPRDTPAAEPGSFIESLMEALPKRPQPEGSRDGAKKGLAMRLKALLRLLEHKDTSRS